MLSVLNDMTAIVLDIGKTLYKRGPVRCLGRLYSIKGFEKGANALIPILEIFKACQFSRVNEWLDIIYTQKDLYDSTFVVFGAAHKTAKKPSIAQAVLTVGYISRTVEVLNKYEVLNLAFKKPSEGFFLGYSILKLREHYSHDLKTSTEKRRHFLDVIFHVGRIAIFVLKTVEKKGEARFGFSFFVACKVIEIATYQVNLIKFFVK